ncbi:MAG: alkaline phosphatase family protein [Chloroflexi bacterium]|nr:alkaline phosphatase family protein [Chloroflexota bacterium]
MAPWPKTVVLCIDGLDPSYIEATPTPAIDDLAAAGYYAVGQAVVPTVTNVNNVSIVTGTPPNEHGITANYVLDPRTGRETYMESAEFLCRPTILDRARRRGLSTAALTAKQKLLDLVGQGADYALCAEAPDAEMVQKLGPPPDIYAPDLNLWLLKALALLLREQDPDLVYCATTDGMMHRYAPESLESQAHIRGLDVALGHIAEDAPRHRILLTADHGMSGKEWGVDLEKALASGGIVARAIPIIKDRYVVHHGNLGGAAYVHLADLGALDQACALLSEIPGVEEVHPRQQAADRFQLMAERIGDLLVLADAYTVFGTFEAVRVPVRLRSHGSRHEGAIPILAYGPEAGGDYKRNYELTAGLCLG